MQGDRAKEAWRGMGAFAKGPRVESDMRGKVY